MSVADLLLLGTPAAAVTALGGSIFALIRSRRAERVDAEIPLDVQPMHPYEGRVVNEVRRGQPAHETSVKRPTMDRGSITISALVSLVSVLSLTAVAVPIFNQVRVWTNTGNAQTPVDLMKGGCATFSLFAQNQFDPSGAVTRSSPTPAARKLGSFGPNASVLVDGWVRGKPAIPNGMPPLDSDIWFHLANNSGWVAFPAVRAVPTEQKRSGQQTPQALAPTPRSCEGQAVRDPGYRLPPPR
jgi:hypothetical protein